MKKTGHIFAGAGGGMLADLILGHTPIMALEIDNDCCRTLEQSGYFPECEIINQDIREFNASRWKGRLDILHAGIPCPRWSSAKRGRGETFDGWPETFRVIDECRPKEVFLECVANFKREHERAKSDLSTIGYTLGQYIITDASSVGAPHSRRRYWAIAYANDQGKPMRHINAKVAMLPPTDCGLWWETSPRISRMDDGVANRVYRFKVTGNGQFPLQAASAYLILTQ